MSGVSIKYSDVAVGAKESFAPSAMGGEAFSDVSLLQQNNVVYTSYANPCELNSFILSGEDTLLPDNPESVNIGLWSEQVSDDMGRFATPIELSLTANENYTSAGITLTFDTGKNIYASDVNIKWYRGAELIADADFAPDNAFYFCKRKVEFYNKVVITFKALNVPNNRLRLWAIDYGINVVFTGKDLRGIKIIQEIDPISTQIAINTCDLTLGSTLGIDFSFQTKQPFNVYFDDELKAVAFIKSAKRKGKNLWEVSGEDYIGLLDSIPFYGGIYSNKNAVELLGEIFAVAKVPYEIDPSLAEITVTGYMPYTTCRDALMQVIFAIGAVADTSNSTVVKIYTLSDEVTQTIPLKRIMQGQSFGEETRVTAVEVVAHTYTQSTETAEVYNATQSGTGSNIFVPFSEPLYGLSISNGTIVESGANYAIINANSGCVLTGKKYTHTTYTKRKENPLVLATDIENIVAIEEATLVSKDNVDDVLNKCYNYLVKVDSVSLRIVEAKHTDDDGNVYYDQKTNVGEIIEAETEYLGTVTGRIYRQSFNLNSGIIVKDSEMK